MKQSLLVGAIPRTAARGPKVRLQRGKWKLGCEGLIDSKVFFTISFPPLHENHNTTSVQHNKEFVIEHEYALVCCWFEEKGTESHISIFAERIQ